MDLIHGGDAAGYRLRHDRDALDFSASLNPLGMPPAVRAAAREAVDASAAYPDPLCRALAAALAEKLNLPERFLCFGNGAADVIHRLALAARPVSALVAAPAFAEYERALAAAGCPAERHVLSAESNFDLRRDILLKISAGLDMLVLCQPNNPTGRLVEPPLMEAILKRCAASGTLLAVDECFLRFVGGAEEYSLKRFLPRFDNLFIVDSFTKLYGMAGLRLGYGLCADAALLERVAGAGQPWPVSTVAQAAGLAALAEDAFVAESLALVRREKPVLRAGLERRGMDVIGGGANYLFFHSAAADLAERLEEEGIMIRDCANFPGLEPGYFRVAVRRGAENAALLEAMEKVLNR